MRTPEYLREQAFRMLAVALKTDDKPLIDHLTVKAGEYLDEAYRLERLNAETNTRTEADK